MPQRLTERQFFLVSLGGLGFLLSVLYLAVLRPGLRERAVLRADIEQMTRQLRKSGYFMGEGPLLKQKSALEAEYARRLEEWRDVSQRLATFENQEQWAETEVGNIDYKFQLHITRRRLGRKAAEQRIEVPALLGLPDEIASNDVARELMLQLRSVEKLVDTAIEYGIADIRGIDPLPPVRHTVGATTEVYLEEYPMRVTFEGDMQRLYRLWEAMFQPHRALLLRNVAMEKTALQRPDQVRMTATLSALLFLKDPGKIKVLQPQGNTRQRARGH